MGLGKLFKDFRREIEYCTYCPKMCRFACPVAHVSGREALHPTSKMTLLHLIEKGSIEWDESIVGAMYACVGCITSRTFCEHRIEVYPVYEAARALAVKKGIAPERVMQQDKIVEKHNNPYGIDLAAETKKIAGEKASKSRARTLLFPGCTSIQFHPKNIQDAIKVMDAAGMDFRVWQAGDVCCGAPSLDLGHEDSFRKLAARVAESIEAEGIEEIVSLCPTCVNSLKNVYPQKGIKLKARVRHLSEVLDEKLESGALKLKPNNGGSYAYHDPCHLGRYLNVYDAPRKLLTASIGNFEEFRFSRDESFCCGGGGGLLLTNTDMALDIARERVGQVDSGGDIKLVSFCPTCDKMLARGTKGRAQVVDVINLVANALV